MGHGRVPILLLTLTLVITGQTRLGPDEINAHSRPYVPPPPPDALRSEVKLVEVPVVVRDGKHHAVAGLKQSDFQVFDSGKEQTISMFSVESQPAATTDGAPASGGSGPATAPSTAAPAPVHPRFIALCFDNVSSTFADLRYTKLAAQKFVKTGLTPGDRVAVFTTASNPTTVTFSDDVDKLTEAIEKVNPQPRFSDSDASQCPRITAYQAYLITNNMDGETFEGVVQEDMACKNLRHPEAAQDVIGLAHMAWEHSMATSRNTLYSIGGLVDALSKLPGRRMILLASSGFLSGNLEFLLDEMTTKALHAEVVINSLDAKGLYTMVPGRPIDAPAPRGRNSVRTQIAESKIQSRQESAKDDAMAVLALGTGGSFYHNSNDFDKGFHELGSIPEAVYILGFSPSSAAPDGRYHNLKVKLTGGHHYSLQSRMGYTAPTKDPPPAERKPSRLDTEALATDKLEEVPITLAAMPAPPENGNPSLKVALHLDLKHMKFDMSTDRRAVKLNYIVAILATGGAFVAGAQGEVELALKAATYDSLSPEGLNIILPLQASAGSYTLRAVVQEGIEGKMSASSMPIQMQ